MSIASVTEARCPKCGGEIPVTYYESLNTSLNPELKKSLLDGSLFSTDCPSCGYSLNFVFPLLYHDVSNRVLIQYTPNREDAEEYLAAAEETLSLFNTTNSERPYIYRVVFDPNELREKATLFDLGLDDRAAEITKFICALNLNKTDPQFEIAACFLAVDSNGGYHVQFLSANGKSHITDIDKAMYDDVANSFAAIITDKSKDRYIIDCRWAANAIK